MLRLIETYSREASFTFATRPRGKPNSFKIAAYVLDHLKGPIDLNPKPLVELAKSWIA